METIADPAFRPPISAVPPIDPSRPLGPQRPVALRFSNVFIPGPPKRQSELDFVDVLLDTDVPLFVDPFAFKCGSEPRAIECHNLVVGFFQELIDSMRSNLPTKAQGLLHNLHEPNESRLGLSSGLPQGRGIGGMQATRLYNAFGKSKAVKTGILKDLSDCELFIEGISHDKISDITINIIRLKLAEFTQEQCRKWDIQMAEREVGPFWNDQTDEWQNDLGPLPVYNGHRIILVPKRFVRYHMAIDDREYYNHHVVEHIRQEFMRQENVNSNASLTRVLKAGRRITKKETKEKHPFSKAMLLEFSEQHPEVLREYKREAEQRLRRGEGIPSDSGIHEKVKETAHHQFKILIEEVNVNIVQGDNFGAVGKGNSVYIRDIAVYKSEVDASLNIDPTTRQLLKQAIDAIEVASASDQEKNEAKEDLHKLTEELKKPEKEPGAICRYLTRLAAVLPSVATILLTGKEIAEAIGGIHIPGITA
jgi:hypothetical protein